MNENYWEVHRGLSWAVITCPLCDDFFSLPNLPNEVESYNFCPHCGERLKLREEDKYKYENEYR